MGGVVSQGNNLVLTMAGRSSRFRHLTHKPKWTIEIDGKSLLQLSIESLQSAPFELGNISFVVLSDQLVYLKHLIDGIDLPCEHRFVQLEHVPNGQLISAREGTKGFKNEPTIVWNIDTFLREARFGPEVNFPANAFVVSQLRGTEWSFAEILGDRVVRTAEKVRISPYASVGMYGFETGELLWENFLQADSGELYVAPYYNGLIDRGHIVTAIEISAADVFPLGTPEQMKESCMRLGVPYPFS